MRMCKLIIQHVCAGKKESTSGQRKLTSSDETHRNPGSGESCGMEHK